MGSCIPNDIRQNNASMSKTLRENKKSHPKCVSIGYLNINSKRNKFSDIPFSIENNLDVFIIAETKLVSSFPETL